MAQKNKMKELAAFSWGNCDQGKWKRISEVANLLEDAHQIFSHPLHASLW